MTSKSKAEVTNRQLASMSGWDVAKALGCEYSGDADPINHGGYFYDFRDWRNWGYASVVEFYEMDDRLYVQPGTINRPDDDERMRDAYRCIGQDWNNPADRNNLCMQVEACRAYFGIEPDTYYQCRPFDIDNWREERIWKLVRGLIEQLGQ